MLYTNCLIYTYARKVGGQLSGLAPAFCAEGLGFDPRLGQQKKEKQAHMSNTHYKYSVQSGLLQSRVWMEHVVAVLHCVSGDDWGSRYMYPDSCGLPDKFHTNSTYRTETSRTSTLHTQQHKSGSLTSQQEKNNYVAVGWGLWGTQRGRPAVYSLMPQWGMSPQYRQHHQLHPEREIEL